MHISLDTHFHVTSISSSYYYVFVAYEKRFLASGWQNICSIRWIQDITFLYVILSYINRLFSRQMMLMLMSKCKYIHKSRPTLVMQLPAYRWHCISTISDPINFLIYYIERSVHRMLDNRRNLLIDTKNYESSKHLTPLSSEPFERSRFSAALGSVQSSRLVCWRGSLIHCFKSQTFMFS